MVKRKGLGFAAALIFSQLLFANDNEKAEPFPIGNFSVPFESQIAPLISFGQLIIGKNCLLPQVGGLYVKGHKEYSNGILPNVVYGIRDDLSVAFFSPYFFQNRSGSFHSSGIGDVFLQGEYAYYRKSAKDYTLQGTVVGSVFFPTGSSKKDPHTGNGAFSYFLGTTFAYVSYHWYAFFSPGALLTTSSHGTKFGNSYLYQCGFARYIKSLSPKGWIFDFMIEFDGTYVEKDKRQGVIDPDSGGNTLVMTPSLWLSSKHLILQWGIGLPLLQNLNGNEDKIKYEIAYNLGVAFQF